MVVSRSVSHLLPAVALLALLATPGEVRRPGGDALPRDLATVLLDVDRLRGLAAATIEPIEETARNPGKPRIRGILRPELFRSPSRPWIETSLPGVERTGRDAFRSSTCPGSPGRTRPPGNGSPFADRRRSRGSKSCSAASPPVCGGSSTRRTRSAWCHEGTTIPGSGWTGSTGDEAIAIRRAGRS